MREKRYFETHDFSLATTLSMFYPVARLDKSDPKQCHFIFEKSAELDDLIDQYYRKEIAVEPRAFYNAERELKSRIYN